MTFIYPYKIFTTAKNKALYKESEPWRKIGIYTYDKYNYNEARLATERIEDSNIAVLLETLYANVKLMCIDMDHCYDNGVIRPEARDFLSFFDKDDYEQSQSGDGFHIFILTTKDFKSFKMALNDSKRNFTLQETMGCDSWEFWAELKYIVTTTFDFEDKNFKIGKYDDLIEGLYQFKLEKDKEVEKKQAHSDFTNSVLTVFEGQIDNDESKARAVILGREPVTDMYKLRGCANKDDKLRNLIDANASTVDQSSHDAALIAKLLYYTLSYEGAWNLATKTNYYQGKDEYHKKKFNRLDYRERTNNFIRPGRY